MLPVETIIPDALSKYIEGLKAHDVKQIGFTLADSIQFVTPARTMGKDEILAFLAALYSGFPDWRYEHESPKRLKNGSYAVKWKQGGTHTGHIEFPGYDGVPPTGKTVVIPEHSFFYKVINNELVEIRPDPIPGGAPRGIFEQIGVEIPPL